MSKVSEAEVRAEVREWLAANWDPDMPLVEWRSKLADSGWGMPQWPTEWYGRGLPHALARVVEEEFANVGAVRAASSGVRLLAAATLLEHGSDQQKKKFLRRILTGEDTWCQFFSEPGSGSDLAGATTRADLKGDFWIVNGQKVWTTSAHHADHGLLLARTDWDAPKHEGLSYFVINLKQPGVDVQPLKQMNGHASFNQVFFTDAKVPKENLVGSVGDGWKVAMTTLAHERRGVDAMSALPRSGSPKGRIYLEERAETQKANQPYTWYPQRAGRVDLIIDRAKETGANKDPRRQSRRASLRPRTYADYGHRRDAHRPRKPARRNHRRNSGLGARRFHRRRHRRNPAQHHRRACPRATERTPVRHRPIPKRAKELRARGVVRCLTKSR